VNSDHFDEILAEIFGTESDLGVLEDAISQALGSVSLLQFTELTWHAVEPATPFVGGWAIEAICDHLEAVASGDITRLLMNVPPGFCKSLMTNVFFPAYCWGPMGMASTRYVTASYASSLTQRDNLRFRQLISSDIYRKMWGHVFGMSKDSNNVVKVGNDKTGWKLATSVGGVGTGERGDCVIIDDPNSVKEAESDVVRNDTNRWFLEVIPSRLNKPETSSIVVIQQRTHDEDVSGIIMSKNLGYEHLMIPMEYDPTRHCSTSIGWSDPRGTVDGDPYEELLNDTERYANSDILAFPERFPRFVVERDKKIMGPYAASGQLQQKPVPRGGGIFKEEWWRLWPPEDVQPPAPGRQRELPPFDFILASLDTGYTEKEENDPSALVIFGVFKPVGLAHDGPKLIIGPNQELRSDVDNSNKIMLINAWEKHLIFRGPPEDRPPGVAIKEWNGPEWIKERQKKWGLIEWVMHTCRHYRVNRLLIEAKASGITVAQEIQNQFQNEDFDVVTFNPTQYGDKVARAHGVVHLFSNGRVYAPQIYVHDEQRWDYPTWARLVLDRMGSFPKGARKDIVDATTQALRHLRDIGLASRTEEDDAIAAELEVYQPPIEALYDV
jgi:hypothetical protein